jgi:hypothetical protein
MTEGGDTMRVFGKSLSEYIKFERVFLILILVVGLGRLGLSLAGVPNSKGKFLSLTVLLLLGFIFYSVRVHTSGFGSYKQLYPVLALQWITAQLIIIFGIVLSIATWNNNIYSDAEFSGGRDGKTWGHVGAHFLFGMVAAPLLLWGLGSVIMLIVKRVAPGSRH